MRVLLLTIIMPTILGVSNAILLEIQERDKTFPNGFISSFTARDIIFFTARQLVKIDQMIREILSSFRTEF